MGDWRRWTPESVESIGGNMTQYTAEQGAPQTLMEQMVDVLGCIDAESKSYNGRIAAHVGILRVRGVV